MVTWTLRARGADYSGGDVYTDWTGELIERHNLPDSLQVTGPLDHLRGLCEPGIGVTLADDTGFRFSGPMTEFTKKGDRTCTVTFASDLLWLWDRIVYANPAAAWPSQAADHDSRSGPAETVALAYIDVNAGPSALAARQVAGLTVPASAGRGLTTPVTARFDNLGQLVADLLELSGLRIRLVPGGSGLTVDMDTVDDLSTWARYGTAEAGGPGVLSEDWVYTVKAPEVTRGLVGGEGVLAARLLRERDDAAAEALWGRRVETFVDQNNSSDTTELDAAGDRAVADGATPVEIRATVPDTPGLILGQDVPLGSKVALDLDGDVVIDRLRQVTTSIGVDGITRKGVVGSPTAGLTSDQKRFFALHKALRKVQAK